MPGAPCKQAYRARIDPIGYFEPEERRGHGHSGRFRKGGVGGTSWLYGGGVPEFGVRRQALCDAHSRVLTVGVYDLGQSLP